MSESDESVDFNIRQAQILLVDDDKDILKFLKIHLNRFFSNITICSQSKEALKIVLENHFDLILADIVMPKLNGLKLLKEIRDAKPGLPVVLMSGYVNESNRKGAKKLDINEIIDKPIDLKHLYQVMREELLRSRYSEDSDEDAS